MLDPEYIETAGDMVGAVYGEIEDELLEYLCRLLLSNADAVGQRGLTAINLLAQTQAPYLRQVIDSHKGEVSQAVAKTVLAAIERSDARDAAVTKTGQALASSRPRQVEQTVTGIAAILERDNVEMVRGALDLWNNAVTEAVTKVNTGTVTAEKAIHGAVRRMMREGVSTIQYRNAATGAQTVKNHIDVAVRRHVRTQIAQDGARRTMQVCEDAGVSLVEVSSHGGARPSHAKWQGRVYSLKGDVTIDGVRYKDFYRETGYGSVDGLLGANCVPGDTEVSGPRPQVAFRREYEGDVIVIHTTAGDELTTTPNHPILTDKGWVAAKLVKKGDHVFRAARRDGVPAGIGPNDDHAPAPIAEVFDALRDAGEVDAFLGSPGDFHGDGIADGEVDVVLADGLLVNGGDATDGQQAGKLLLHETAGLSAPLFSDSALAEVGVRPLHSSDGLMGGTGVRRPLIGRHPRIPGPQRIAAGFGRVASLGESLAYDHIAGAHADGDIVFGNAGFVKPDNLVVIERNPAAVGLQAKFSEAVSDDLPAHAETTTYLVKGQAFLVEPCEVCDVHRDAFCGHVYNLQTGAGWYFANDIVTHNCRHSFGPWISGTPRMYSPNPEHPSGLSNDEVYALTQGQRYRERQIRQTKRELKAAQLIADDDASLANVAEVEKLKDKLKRQQAGLRDYIAEANAKGKADVLQRSPNREWAGDMPRIRKTDASRRTVKEFMAQDSVTKALKKRGVSKASAQKALSAELKKRGVSARDFSLLSKTNQREVFKTALPSATPVKSGRRTFPKIKGDHTAAADLLATNPGWKASKAAGDMKYTHNCQRCVPTYEMRRRGYDVVAKPLTTDAAGKVPKTDRAYYDWTKIFDGATFERCGGSGKKKCDSLMKQWGDGARAEVYVSWKGRNSGAHVFVAENRGGKVVYIDPQTGSENATGYFKNAQIGRTMIARLDGLSPSKLIDDCCTSRKGGTK